MILRLFSLCLSISISLSQSVYISFQYFSLLFDLSLFIVFCSHTHTHVCFISVCIFKTSKRSQLINVFCFFVFPRKLEWRHSLLLPKKTSMSSLNASSNWGPILIHSFPWVTKHTFICNHYIVIGIKQLFHAIVFYVTRSSW